ncbi:MAG: 3-deoxy-8-phosphooctulonate synthase [Candidatus Delongbacteria bacterium]|nr:3-deoxy-8-phosphooctulonate synthase [Candidatus Delongbacteria bacterium]MBN2836343.1 3-deoxy-8-phosphooctulonate synthase [Candidatus Delongbacteria bacterium]
MILIAGPCVIEDIGTMKKIADSVKQIEQIYNINVIFKASYKKANRSSINSYTGPGLDEGLRILSDIGKDFELPILTDVHETTDVKVAAEVADILQIPAFLCRQTDLLTACGNSGRYVNIKKGQFVSPQEMDNAVKKVESTGNAKIFLTERGTFFGYNNLVVDFRSFGEMKKFNKPVIYDATHSLQRPAATGTASGGEPDKVRNLARAAMATGWVDGLFIETHPEPLKGRSDALSMVNLEEFKRIVSECLLIKGLVWQ